MRGLDRIAADRRHLVAAQVRCATGYTLGQVVDGEARLVALSPRGRPVAVVERAPVVRRVMAEGWVAPLPGRLLAWLEAQPAGGVLPRPLVLGRMLGEVHEQGGKLSSRVILALDRLAATGRLVQRAWMPADGLALRGERAVLVCATGRVLRTAAAPTGWLAEVEGVAR